MKSDLRSSLPFSFFFVNIPLSVNSSVSAPLASGSLLRPPSNTISQVLIKSNKGTLLSLLKNVEIRLGLLFLIHVKEGEGLKSRWT